MSSERDPELEAIYKRKLQAFTREASLDEKTKTAPSSPVEVTDENFTKLKSTHPVMVIDCWATWCGPCRMIAPIIDDMAKDYAGRVVFGKLDVDANPVIPSQLGIMSIPTLLFVKNGKIADTIVGAVPRQTIETRLQRLL